MADISREIERARPALLRYAKKLTRWALTTALLLLGVLAVADRPWWAWVAFVAAGLLLMVSNRYRALRLLSASAYAGLMAAFALMFRDGLCVLQVTMCVALGVCDD